MDINLVDVSIVIVNYNTAALLRNCLTSVTQTEGRVCQVIVVDNGSADGSPDMVEREFPGVCLVRNRLNSGFAKANNQGIRLAKSKYILLLNSDTIVRPGALGIMTGFLDSDAAAAGAGCRLLNEDGTIQASISDRPGPVFLFFRLLGVSRLISGDLPRHWLARMPAFLLGKTVHAYLTPYVGGSSPIEVESMSAACLMLRKKAVEEVGLLDEGFFMYLEDMDYCIRLKQAGWKLYYLPAAAIVHLGGGSSGGRMRNYSVESYRALFYFYRKHYSRATVVAARTIAVMMLCLRWFWNWIGSIFSKKPIYRQNALDLRQVIRVCFDSAERI